MARPLVEQVIALAGVAQATRLVDQAARTGSADPQALETAIRSLFEFNPANTEAVYGSLDQLKPGLESLRDLLGQPGDSSAQAMARYLSGLLYLERKLSSQPDVLTIIRNRLEHVSFKAEHFSDDPASLIASIAGLYQDTISKFRFRIHVNGNPSHLQNEANANLIRALLLSGIRSAILWRQVGGRRWKLLLQKSAIQHTVDDLLAEISV